MSKIILDGLIRNFFATTTRQIIFSNTEYILNNYVNESKSFTKESIKQAYIEMIDKYEGIRKKDKYKKIPYAYSLSTILRIPHFYAGNFYVYKYAIGQIVALVVAEEIHKNNQDMINKYFNFLSSGDSKSPIDTIKILGIDLYNEEVYIKAKTTISNWINNLGKFVKY
jgi:oligoendopeptidase F